ATATSDASGIFTASFQVPPSKHGDHTITVSDGTSTDMVIFTVESMAPSVPLPLLPTMGSEVELPISFDWEEVTDESSPVTYTLQIATDKNFTADSIVLDKKGLTKSEYTLIETEELKLETKETSYYWRVRAIDAAQNKSGWWMSAGEFYVIEPFNFPSWAIYFICIIVVLFIAGFLLSSNIRKRRLLLEGKKAELINMIDEALEEDKE
ncbi:MAG: hypothetical protein U9Q17_03505, partial [Chloroflexota bacterium]|nr:hypothetical protein [Chloroflexota bacterium]